jgi:hypothetical protein
MVRLLLIPRLRLRIPERNGGPRPALRGVLGDLVPFYYAASSAI